MVGSSLFGWLAGDSRSLVVRIKTGRRDGGEAGEKLERSWREAGGKLEGSWREAEGNLGKKEGRGILHTMECVHVRVFFIEVFYTGPVFSFFGGGARGHNIQKIGRVQGGQSFRFEARSRPLRGHWLLDFHGNSWRIRPGGFLSRWLFTNEAVSTTLLGNVGNSREISDLGINVKEIFLRAANLVALHTEIILAGVLVKPGGIFEVVNITILPHVAVAASRIQILEAPCAFPFSRLLCLNF
jgi:hypothetical protein